MPVLPATTGLGLVREATRSAHLRVEALVEVTAWNGARHQWWLGRQLGIREPLEAALDRWWAGSDLRAPFWPARRRSDLVRSDLMALGVSPSDLRALPRCVPAAGPWDLPEVLGQLYVLDGSALGGAVIAARALDAGVDPAACASLLPRRSTGGNWRETRFMIEALGAAEARRAAVAAADLFELFERWLSPSPPTPTELSR
jgi:heme oxygenase